MPENKCDTCPLLASQALTPEQTERYLHHLEHGGENPLDAIFPTAANIARVEKERDEARARVAVVESALPDDCRACCDQVTEYEVGELTAARERIAELEAELAATTERHKAVSLECHSLHDQLREGCTCGSGDHPRHCSRHPGAYEEHCRQMSDEHALDAWTEWAGGHWFGNDPDAARDAIDEELGRGKEARREVAALRAIERWLDADLDRRSLERVDGEWHAHEETGDGARFISGYPYTPKATGATMLALCAALGIEVE